jgi:flagellar hook-basal body complex protein FliE
MSNSIQALPQPEFNAPINNQQPSKAGTGGFMDLLRGAIGETETLQKNAQEQVSALLNGTGQDVHSAMIEVEKADLSFQLMMQVRNKIVQAYQEISRLNF